MDWVSLRGPGNEKDRGLGEDKRRMRQDSDQGSKFVFFFSLFYAYEYTVAVQMVVSHPVVAGNLNSGPWEKQSVLLTAEPSLQLKAPSLIFRESPQTHPLFQLGYVAKQAQWSVYSSKFL